MLKPPKELKLPPLPRLRLALPTPRLSAPAFWHKPSLLGHMLSPLGQLYGGLTRTLQAQAVPLRPPVPVWCVGNAVMGGAGKTPVTIALAELAHALSEVPHILCRGYGAELDAPICVDATQHSAAMVGDEAIVLARAAACWSYPVRAASARQAITAGASLLLMDDGLQHTSLVRDTSFLVLDTAYQLGNGKLFPAGPMRETLADTLAKTDAIIALGEGPCALPGAEGKPIFRAQITPGSRWEMLRDKPVFAFSGLANNAKFFRMCKAQGMHVVDAQGFADHHAYSRSEAKLMIRRAELLGATPVTTEKDAVKLHPDELRKVVVLPVSVQWENRLEILQYLIARLAAFRLAPPELLF